MSDRQSSMSDHLIATLNRFWNELLRPTGAPVAGDEGLDPALTETVRRLQSLGAAPPPASSRERVRRAVRANVQSRLTSDKETPVTPTGFFDLTRPIAGPNGRSDRPSTTMPRLRFPAERRKWLVAQFATALLLVVTLLAIYFAFFNGNHPAPQPAVVVGTPVPATPVVDWPTYGSDPDHNRVLSEPGPVGQPAARWLFQAGPGNVGGPVVAAGTVYVGSDDGNLYAIDAATGVERWRFALGPAAGLGPTVAAGLVYAAGEDAILYAFDAATGQESWRMDGARAFTAPSVVDGVLYTGTEDGGLVAVDAATGAERWRVTVGGLPARSPAVIDGVVYLGSTDEATLHAFATADGHELWSFQTDGVGGAISPAVVAEGTVYVTYYEGAVNHLYAIDPATGQERWRFAGDAGNGARVPSIAGGIVYVGSDDGNVYALDAATGQERWRFATQNRVSGGILAAGVFYAASFDGNLYALDAASGREVWRYPLDGTPNWGMAMSGGVAYVSTSAGTLSAIGGSDGTPVAPPPTTAAATSTATGDAGAATAAAVAGSRCAAATESGASTPVFGGVEFVWAAANGTERVQGPAGMDVAPDGTLWVPEIEKDRILVFDPSGRVIEAWGTSGSGDGQFEFGDQGGIGFDPEGNIFVLDKGHNRIQKFDSNRSFVTAWGSSGTGDGQFILPSDIEVDADGNVYVADGHRHDVQKFDNNGSFLGKIDGSTTADGAFAGPPRIGVDAQCNLYVPDHYTVHKFSPDGTLLLTFGSEGTGDGQFTIAIDVAVDAAGNIYVTDAPNHRIEVFDQSGRFLGTWGEFGTGPGQFNETDAITLDDEGNIYAVDFQNGRIQKFRILPATDSEANASPVAGEKAAAGPVDFLWQTTGGSQPFNLIWGVTVAPDGRLWVADSTHSIFQIFNPDGTFAEAWGTPGKGDGQFDFVRPASGPDAFGAVAFASDGSFFVADTGNHRIQHFAADRSFLSAWGEFGGGEGQLNSPICLVVDAHGNVIVGDDIAGTVQAFDANGSFLYRFDLPVGVGSQLAGATSLAVDADGNVWLADPGDGMLVEWDGDGHVVATWGRSGSVHADLAVPVGLDFDDAGRLYVANAESASVVVFDATGNVLASWGSHGRGNGEFLEPGPLTLDGQGTVFVVDRFGRVQAFRLLPPLAPEATSTP